MFRLFFLGVVGIVIIILLWKKALVPMYKFFIITDAKKDVEMDKVDEKADKIKNK